MKTLIYLFTISFLFSCESFSQKKTEEIEKPDIETSLEFIKRKINKNYTYSNEIELIENSKIEIYDEKMVYTSDFYFDDRTNGVRVIEEFSLNDMKNVDSDFTSDAKMYGQITIRMEGNKNKRTMKTIIGAPYIYPNGSEYINNATIYCSLTDLEAIINAFRNIIEIQNSKNGNDYFSK